MASKRFKKIFLIRFFTYFSIITGFIIMLAQFGPVLSVEINYRLDQITGKKHQLAQTVITSQGQIQSEDILEGGANPEPQALEGFGDVAASGEDLIKPVSTEFGLVIEKINANAKIVPQVDPGIEKDYVAALKEGIAQAKGSTEPGEDGNLFLFSHSTDAPWNITRYNAIFYLLRELESGDRVIVFYKNRRFDYIVFDKTITEASDISFYTNRYDKPVLTLQTCDPPGTVLKRLIVRAKLAGS
ncbi:sortase [Candidatus Daviesbacteria bacterium]|nr:sortase [Candidatus Daviesbacteria bacterium]